MKTVKVQDGVILHGCIFIICFFPIAGSILMTTNGYVTAIRLPGIVYDFGLPCLFLSLTGYRCLVCGMTRCFIYMGGFQFFEAWKINTAGVFLYAYCLFQIPCSIYLLIKIFRRKVSRLAGPVYVFLGILLSISCSLILSQFILQFFD